MYFFSSPLRLFILKIKSGVKKLSIGTNGISLFGRAFYGDGII